MSKLRNSPVFDNIQKTFPDSSDVFSRVVIVFISSRFEEARRFLNDLHLLASSKLLEVIDNLVP